MLTSYTALFAGALALSVHWDGASVTCLNTVAAADCFGTPMMEALQLQELTLVACPVNVPPKLS